MLTLEIEDVEGAVRVIRDELPLRDDDTARACGLTLRKLVEHAAADARSAGFDPGDLHEVFVGAKTSVAVGFVHACRECAATLEFYADHDDHSEMLDRVLQAGRAYLRSRAGSPDPVVQGLHDKNTLLGTKLSEAWMQANSAQMSIDRQIAPLNVLNGGRQGEADARAQQASEILGRADLLAAIRDATAGQIEQLAALYGFTDPATFKRDALYNGSALRKKIARDQKRL